MDREDVDIYFADKIPFTFHGYLAPSTSYITDFKLQIYHPGIVVLFKIDEDKDLFFEEEINLSKSFSKSKKWTNLLDIGYVHNVNEIIKDNQERLLIEVSEAYFENEISKLCDEIVEDDDINFILLAGPSSSGKTTTANRIKVQLTVRGKKPFLISTDDYFTSLSERVLLEDGKPDFESVNAIDIKRFNEDMISLLDGKAITLPKYNFEMGKSETTNTKIYLDRNHPVLIEGTHALNPELTKLISEKNKYKIYISSLTQLNLDMHNRISTTDVRLLRRLIRDARYRNFSALNTLEHWESVLEGERKYIFTYQDSADFQLDSSLIYEINTLKKYAKELLLEIGKENAVYKEAKRLLKFLDYFIELEDEKYIPINSVLREFIG